MKIVNDSNAEVPAATSSSPDIGQQPEAGREKGTERAAFHVSSERNGSCGPLKRRARQCGGIRRAGQTRPWGESSHKNRNVLQNRRQIPLKLGVCRLYRDSVSRTAARGRSVKRTACTLTSIDVSPLELGVCRSYAKKARS